MLKPYLLGAPRLEWEDQLLSITRCQVRAVLYRLSVRPHVISRDELCFLIWPNMPDSQARRHLSHLLSHLRTALPDKNILQVSKNNVYLDKKFFVSDTETFEKLHSLATVEAHQQAVELYHGRFLSGFSLPDSAMFERWVSDEGYHFENLYLESLSTLLENAISSEKYLTAIKYAQAYLAVDNLAEAIHRKLIGLYSASGNRNAALKQFERCTVILERELGVRPLPETRALYESILTRKAEVLAPSNIKPSLTKLPDVEVPLVGRETESQRLEQIWDQTKAGSVQVVFISGEAGIGKSHLIKAFINKHNGEALILTSTCQSITRSIPYQSLVEALSPLVTNKWNWTASPGAILSPSSTSYLSDTWLAESARLLPDLRKFYPKLPDPLPLKSEEARGRLFEALARMFLSLAYNPLPLIMVFDNLHWADKATLEWLEFWGNYLHVHQQQGYETPRIFVVIAYRAGDEQAVTGLQRSLAKTIRFTELPLSGLDGNAVRQLVSNQISSISHTNDIDQSSLTNWLERVSGSNPLYLIETMHALIEKGLLGSDFDKLSDIPILNSLKLALDERMQNLSLQAIQVLGAGAILDGNFDFDLIRLTSGRSKSETISALEALIARQFLIEKDSKIRFRHELIRQSVIDNLGPVRRGLLHQRAGMALEKLQPDAVVNIAYHYEQGNTPLKALHYHEIAAQQAEDVFAWQEAEENQNQLLLLLDQIDPKCSHEECRLQRSQILVSRAHLRYLQGRIADRDADLAALDELAESGPDKIRLLAVMEKVRYSNLDSHYEKALEAAQEGLSISAMTDNQSVRVNLLTQIGFAHYFLGQPELALTALESAMDIPNHEFDPNLLGRISHILGYVYFHLGEIQQAMTCQKEAYDYHQQVRDYNRVAWDGLDIGLLLLKMGKFYDAKQEIEKHLALARRISAQPPEAYGLTSLGNWQLYRGNYVEALVYYQQAYVLQQKIGSVKGCIDADGGIGLSFYHLGDVNEARLRLENTLNLARSITHPRLVVQALVSLGLLDISMGQFAKAIPLLQEAVKIARESQFNEGFASGLAALARTQRLLGEYDQALAYAEEALQISLSKELPTNELWGRLEIAAAQLALGNAQAALNQIEKAQLLIPQMHQGWIGVEQVYAMHARVLKALGQLENANCQHRKAEDSIAQKGDSIPDPDTKHRYLSFTNILLSKNI